MIYVIKTNQPRTWKKQNQNYSDSVQHFCPPPLSCLFTLESKYAGCHTVSDVSFHSAPTDAGLKLCGHL